MSHPTAGSAFIFLRLFKLTHSSIQVTCLRTGEEFASISNFSMGNRFHVMLRIVGPQSE